MENESKIPEHFREAILANDTSEATDKPYTDEELEEIRARARGDIKAEEALCTDFWSDDIRPRPHHPRPGALVVRGSPIAFNCRYMLVDYYRFSSDKRFERWIDMIHKHKSQCLACRQGTSIL